MAAAPHWHYWTFALFGTIALSFALFAFSVWLWGHFLDANEHRPARLRLVMMFLLGAVTIGEMQLAAYGLTAQWVATVSLFVNLWGGLDALLRFPAAHEIESFFATKQFALLVTKSLSYAFGICDFRRHFGAFLMVLVLIVWGMPVMYLMALPLDPAEQVPADERDDVDLVLRVWQLTTCQTERQRCLRSCKNWLHRGLVAASQGSPMAKIALCTANPSYKRAFSKDIRSV